MGHDEMCYTHLLTGSPQFDVAEFGCVGLRIDLRCQEAFFISSRNYVIISIVSNE